MCRLRALSNQIYSTYRRPYRNISSQYQAELRVPQLLRDKATNINVIENLTELELHYSIGEDCNEYMPEYEEPFVSRESTDIYYLNDELIIGLEQFQVEH